MKTPCSLRRSIPRQTGLFYVCFGWELIRQPSKSRINTEASNFNTLYQNCSPKMAFHATFDTIFIKVDERQQKHPSFSFWGVLFSFWGVPFSFWGTPFSLYTYYVLLNVCIMKNSLNISTGTRLEQYSYYLVDNRGIIESAWYPFASDRSRIPLGPSRRCRTAFADWDR